MTEQPNSKLQETMDQDHNWFEKHPDKTVRLRKYRGAEAEFPPEIAAKEDLSEISHMIVILEKGQNVEKHSMTHADFEAFKKRYL